MSFSEAYSKALEYLGSKKRAYQLVFRLDQPADIEVMIDLARFCRANESCAIPGDHDKTMILEGRREVWLRIQQMLHLTPEQLFQLYSGNSAAPSAPQGERK